MRHLLAIAVGVAGLSLAAGSAAMLGMRVPTNRVANEPVWAEAKWPFPIDEWGVGRAFVCSAADCGVKVEVYVRPKIGYCNCATGVSDDAELERVGDTRLLSREVRPLGPGHVIKVGWMNGRFRSSSDVDRGVGIVSVAYNDECDVIAAVAAHDRGDPVMVERAVMAFLTSQPMVLWAKKELGLEFISRNW